MGKTSTVSRGSCLRVNRLRMKTRFQIIGCEVLGFGLFIFLLIGLELMEAGSNQIVQSFAWVYGIVGATLILIGLETSGLATRLSDYTS